MIVDRSALYATITRPRLARLWVSVVTSVVFLVLLPPVSMALGPERAYELVSPIQKNGSVAGADNQGTPKYAIAAPGGDAPGENEPAILFGGVGPIGNTLSGANIFTIARRERGTWTDYGLLPRPPRRPGAPPDNIEAFMPSLNLTRAVFGTAGTYVPQNPDSGQRLSSRSLYRESEDALGGRSLEWIAEPTAPNPLPPLGEVGESLNLAGGSLSLDRVYFTYYGTLVRESDDLREAVIAANGGPSLFPSDWGFYEWSEAGGLVNAGMLPDGSYDPFGAVPAATGETTAAPLEFHNEVSVDGLTAFFVSPAPPVDRFNSLNGTYELGRAPQLYAREVKPDGDFRSVLVSKSEITGEPAAHGAAAISDPARVNPSYAFASPDGKVVYFASVDQLTSDTPPGDELKEYSFDIAAEKLHYLAGVIPPIMGVSADGRSFLFYNNLVHPAELNFWSEGSVTVIAKLSPAEGRTASDITVGPVRMSADNSNIIFESSGTVTDSGTSNFNNRGGFEQLYQFNTHVGLSCISCPPPGIVPSGSAHLSNPDVSGGLKPRDNRGISNNGDEVFFDSPDPLVAGDVNGRRDVYEWRQHVLSLVSLGTGTLDSYFLDNSDSGRDIFFTTADDLAFADTDGGYDVYDARVGGETEGHPVVQCTATCQDPPETPPVLGVPASFAFIGLGNASAPATEPVNSKTRKISTKKKSRKRRHRPKRKRKALSNGQVKTRARRPS